MTTTEKQTRQQIIDQRLALAGWDVSDKKQVTEELDIDLTDAGLEVAETDSPYGGHEFADYALLHQQQVAAVIEAKKASKDARHGQEQALQYAEHIKSSHDLESLPFVMYTNGHDIYYWESDFYPPQKVHGFPSRDDLEWLALRQRSRKPLSDELINTNIAGRAYQIEAIRSILEGLEGKRTDFLLTMATGTGKTRTAAALVDVLLRARWAKRVLFLVDRVSLKIQARDAFEEHIPDVPRYPNKGEKGDFPRNRRVYVETYPAMLNLIEAGTTAETWLSPFFFDLIIVDESHRSVYNTYKQILDFFNAAIVGLTATPTDRVDHDTFNLFDCPANDPTFAYTYEEAIGHEPPYLCDFDVLKVRSQFQLEGIRGQALPQPEQRKLIAEGKDIEDIDFEGTDIEKKVSNAGTNALIVREFMEESIKDADGTLPGKSIFFAISKEHAFRLEALFNVMYPEHKGKLARVIVSGDSRINTPQGMLEQFKTQDMPRVAISVDMLDTGVDVPELVNLVFAKPVYSYTKFWQMIGRGTRVLPAESHKRKSWCTDKDRFLIIDCWDNFDYFKMNPTGREPGALVPVPVQLFRARLDQLEAAVTAKDEPVREWAIAGLRDDLAQLPENNVVVAEHRAELDNLAQVSFWQNITLDTVGHLRTRIAPVLRVRTNADFKAMRFERDVVELSTAAFAGEAAVEAGRQVVVQKISELPQTVNTVQKEQALIDQTLDEPWWQDVAVDQLQSLVTRLGPLMYLREGAKRDDLLEIDVRDATVIKEWVEFGPENERISTSAYRDRVEAYIRGLVEQSPVLQKLQQGEAVAESEMMQLAEILRSQDPYVTEELLRKVYDHKTARFIRFIRHILGLEVLPSWGEEVHAAFESFIAEHNTFGEQQIKFLLTLKTFILDKGQAQRPDLIHAPFTNLHPQGIRGLFQKPEIEEIVAFVEGIGTEAA